MPFNFGSLFNFGNSNSRRNNSPNSQNSQANFQSNMNPSLWNNYGHNQNNQAWQAPFQGQPNVNPWPNMLPRQGNQNPQNIPNQFQQNTPNQFPQNMANQFQGNRYGSNQNTIPQNTIPQNTNFNNNVARFNNQMNMLNNPMGNINNQPPPMGNLNNQPPPMGNLNNQPPPMGNMPNAFSNQASQGMNPFEPGRNQMNMINNPQINNNKQQPPVNNMPNAFNNQANQKTNQFEPSRNQMNMPNNFQSNTSNNALPPVNTPPQGNLPNAFNNQASHKMNPFDPSFQQKSGNESKATLPPHHPPENREQHNPPKGEPLSFDKLPVFRPLDGEVPIPEKSKKVDKPSKASFDIKQLKQFIQNERNSSKFYENMANEINDPEARRMFFSFSNKCNEHKKTYSDILTSVNNERFEAEERKIVSGVKFYDGVSLAIKEELESLKDFSTLYDSTLDSEQTKNKLTQIMIDKLIRINYMQYISR